MRRLLLAVFLFSSLTTAARADQGMPLDHVQWLGIPRTHEDPLMQHIDPDHIEGGRMSAQAHSRLESELKVAVPDALHFGRMRNALEQLASNPALAEKVMGKGWYVEYSHDAEYGDTYLDNKSRVLATLQAGARKRVVNGKNLELNVKPPGGVLSGPDGIISTRPERGLTIGPAADLAAIARSSSIWSPVSSLRAAIAGDLAAVMNPSVASRAKRGRFVVGYRGGDESWHRLIDLSADHVYEMKDVAAGAKAQTREVPHIFGLEGDLNHPGSQSGMAIPDVEWSPPHTPADAHRDAFHQDAAVRALHEISPKLLDWMRTTHNVQFARALPKYTQAAINLRLIKASQVKAAARR